MSTTQGLTELPERQNLLITGNPGDDVPRQAAGDRRRVSWNIQTVDHGTSDGGERIAVVIGKWCQPMKSSAKVDHLIKSHQFHSQLLPEVPTCQITVRRGAVMG